MPLTAGDTWGIPGPVFIWLIFVPAAIVLSVVTYRMRVSLEKGWEGLPREPHHHEIAYLKAGRVRVVAAALGALRAEGAIEAAGRGRIRITGAPVTGRTPVDDAVYGSIARAGEIRPLAVAAAPEVTQAVDELHERLVRAGQALGADAKRRRVLVLLVPFGALLALGAVRLLAGLQNGRPVAFLFFAMVIVAAVTVGRAVRNPIRTRAGSRMVAAVEERSGHLDPTRSPAWTTYGAGGAALGVALYGSVALQSLDPELVAEGGMGTLFASSFSGGTSGGGGGCSSGGDGGGGGGGGCGGGGCGG